MLKLNLNARYLNSHRPSGVVECQNHNLNARYLNRPSGVGGNAKNHNLNARYLNSHCPSGLGMLNLQLKCTIS
jgi:hypothetical protein